MKFKNTGEALAKLNSYVKKDLYNEMHRISRMNDIHEMKKAINDIKAKL